MPSKRVFNPELTFKCALARCKTCPFVLNVEKLSGSKRSIKITDHFACTSANVIHWRFREHLRDAEKNDKGASKAVARHFDLPNHSKQHMAVFNLSLHQGSTESRKTLEQNKIFFKSALLILMVSTNAFHSTNLFCYFSLYGTPTNPSFCI